MKVRDWMTKDPITVTEDTPLLDGFRIFREYDIRHLPVVKDQRLVGILSSRDLGHLLIDRYAGRPFQDMETAGDAMTRKVVSIRPDDSVANAAMTMHNRKFGCLPVVDGNGLLVGILTVEDLLEELVAQLQDAV